MEKKNMRRLAIRGGVGLLVVGALDSVNRKGEGSSVEAGVTSRSRTSGRRGFSSSFSWNYRRR